MPVGVTALVDLKKHREQLVSFFLPSIAFVTLPSVPGDQILEDMEAGRSERKRQKAAPPAGLPQDLCN